MTRFIFAVTAAIAFSACAGVDDGGSGGGGGGDPTTPTPPAGSTVVAPEIASNLQSIEYRAADDELFVTLLFLDGTTVVQQYQREAALDIPGGTTGFSEPRDYVGSIDYRAFTQQNDANSRFVTALVGRSSDGSAQASVVTDGGQFGYFFGGASYEQIGTYTKPATGLATYHGSYAGLLNLKITDDFVDVNPNLPPIARPARSTRTVGDVIFRADFADNAVEGLIYNRVEENGAYGLNDILLKNTTTAANGSFVGEAQQRNLADPDDPTLQTIGTYGGVFGGNQASSVAGGINISGFDPDDPVIEEYGVFVLDICGNTGPICGAPTN